ncbi:crossover junction endodeoxyribonuclease RuvC [Bartonella sp. F02]|uniref:crossover junction endodeoxyribonuclease RuvC n=1 Tax=Bartonella sp. F02 TaxID=2967262 RepID=UPI0022A90DB6|nr:crossover junction endodeoxyribonuclease RuvC [Bartonella sp. F02]MCZ2328826.1 crossover junction endodeoxyribonuclease RuvC [Bartonella sp. F02]
MAETIRIIGIDPGLRRTGWGVIDLLGNRLQFVAAGTLHSNAKNDLPSRLCELHKGLSNIVHQFLPHEAAIEHVFVNKDAAATLKLSQARAIALLVPAQAGLPVSEYAPNKVKKSVIGVGHGEKKQIHMMVKVLLPRAEFDSDDAADALALALCHSTHRTSLSSRIKVPA